MNLTSRLKAIEEKRATRGGEKPTVVRLELRNQRFFFDSEAAFAQWQALDPGESGSLRRGAFDLACELSEDRIWPVAERKGLRAELEALLGRGPLTPEELAEAEAEVFHPLTSEEFYRKELTRTVVEAAAAAGEDPPAWLNRDDLTPEQVAEASAWLEVHLAPVEADGTPGVDSEGLSGGSRSNDTTQGENVQQR